MERTQDPNMLKQIELSQAEAQTLIDLCDIATKAAGLRAAREALPIVDKIVAAFGEPAPPAATTDPPETK